MHEQKISAVPGQKKSVSGLRRGADCQSREKRLLAHLKVACLGTEDSGCLRDSWRAQDEDRTCVCVCPSWRMSAARTGRGGAASLFSCTRARRVKSCRGALPLSHAHTLRPWALPHMYTMRLRCLGLGPGPRALGSHTLNQGFIPGCFWDSVPVAVLRVAGRSTAPSPSSSQSSPPSSSSTSILKYEDPRRYLN